MGLVINRTDAKLNIETTRSQLSVQTRKANLELSHKEAKVDVHTDLPRVEVDQYECFATSGLKGILDLTKEAAQRGMQQALNYASTTAQNGDAMGAIENRSDPIPDIALKDAYPEHEFGLDYMPKARPRITVTGGVQVTSQRNSEGISNGVNGNFTPGSITMDYTPSQVKISLEQYASLNMRYERTSSFSSYA